MVFCGYEQVIKDVIQKNCGLHSITYHFRRRTSDHQEDMIKDGGNEVLFNDQITKRRTTWSGSDSRALPHAQTHQSK